MSVGPAISGKQVDLVPVAAEDAEFILSLRTNPVLSRFLHPTSPDAELQRKWIQGQREREGDFYYVIHEKSAARKVGLISLYNCADNHAEVGRWICTEPICAVESLLLLYDFAFSHDLMSYIVLTVSPENKKVFALHKALGAVMSEEETARLKPDKPSEIYVMRRETFMSLKKKFM